MLNKKHLLIIAVSALMTTTASAGIQPGFYIGGMLGWGTTNQNTSHQIVDNNLQDFQDYANIIGFTNTNSNITDDPKDNGGVAGRIFAGYQFNQYFGAELGYSKFSNSKTSSSGYTNSQTTTSSGIPINMSDAEFASVNLSTYAVDLVGKLTAPLPNGFDIYAKLGVAYLNQKGSVDASYTTTISTPFASGSVSSDYGYHNPNTSGYYPTFGLGADYEINKNLSADLSWMHIQVKNSAYNSQLINNTDMVGLGLMYSFS